MVVQSLYACIKVDLCLLRLPTLPAPVDFPSTFPCHITSNATGLALRDGLAASLPGSATASYAGLVPCPKVDYTGAHVFSGSPTPANSPEPAPSQVAGHRSARMDQSLHGGTSLEPS